MVKAFAAEGIPLYLVVRTDRESNDAEYPVKDQLRPTSWIALEYEKCPEEFTVNIFGGVRAAFRAMKNADTTAPSDLVRVTTSGYIGLRRENVVVGFKENSDCVSEEQVSAVLSRLD